MLMKRKELRTITIILCCVMSFSFIGCGKKEDTTQDSGLQTVIEVEK